MSFIPVEHRVQALDNGSQGPILSSYVPLCPDHTFLDSSDHTYSHLQFAQKVGHEAA
jgi:hypothetical protein